MKWRVLFLLVLAGCAADSTIGGYCNTTEDCHSDINNIPGTSCVASKCVCDNPNELHCCPGGKIENCEAQPPNDYRCRPAAECQASDTVSSSGTTTGSGGSGTGGGGTAGTTSSGGSGGEPQPAPECLTDADCPDPPDAACGEGKCSDGQCWLDIWEGPIPSQRYGDCKQSICDVYGKRLDVIDVGDFYNDGNECTHDYCFADAPVNDVFPDGLNCPEAGVGYCFQGQCVACIDLLPYASCGVPGYVCDEVWCENFALCQGGQCGAPCAPCPAGIPCNQDFDCISGLCQGGICQIPTCTDGKANGDESGMDCGAPSCPACPDGEGCKLHSDCLSNVCIAGKCQAPSCTDGVQNDMESGVDCGGSCNPCPP